MTDKPTGSLSDIGWKALRRVRAVDTVVAGDVLRIVVDGLPSMEGREPNEMLRELRDHHEDFRRFLIDPPRGHGGINAGLLFPAYSLNTVRTFVLAAQFGYAPFAGTPMMAAAASLVGIGHIEPAEPNTTVSLDTPRGQFEIQVSAAGSGCFETCWMSKRPKILAFDRPFTFEDGRDFHATIVSCGLPYALVRASSVGADFEDTASLSRMGPMVNRAVMRQLPLSEVGLSEDLSSYAVMVVGEPRIDKDQATATVPVAWVSPDGLVTANPAGTGVMSTATMLARSGELTDGVTLKAVSPTGHSLRCRNQDDVAFVEGTVEIAAIIELLEF